MKNKLSALISITMIFSLLLPTVIPRSYRLQNPEQNSLLIRSKSVSVNLHKSNPDSNEIIDHINSFKDTLFVVVDNFISCGYKSLKYPKKVKFRFQDETDIAQTFANFIYGICNPGRLFHTNTHNIIVSSFPNDKKLKVNANLLELISKKTE